MRRSYVRNALQHAPDGYAVTADDVQFLAEDTNTTPAAVEEMIAGLVAGA
jgi:predicted  nucleic acid-binding Zn ribbon protein